MAVRASELPVAAAPGAVLGGGRYVLQRRLGRSASGDVWLVAYAGTGTTQLTSGSAFEVSFNHAIPKRDWL
jgi:hypothetical protein